ncbi:MAG TPA: hypothetical protein VFT75_17755 [Nocardioidaceae bacterium]|jgi:hypothetical protein|nr:hypothetical protein [Nocardioidaceae bacterium]
MSTPMSTPAATRSAPWAVLVPEATPVVTVPRSPRSQRAAARALRDLPVAASVALVGTGGLNRGRLRRTADAAGVVITHEYVVLPSISSGRYLVEDHPDTVAVLWQSLVTPPPGTTRATALLTAFAAIGRSRLPWWTLGVVAPRMAVGYRGELP